MRSLEAPSIFAKADQAVKVHEEEKRWLVNAWKTGNDNEEGEVIAKISESGEVVYLDAEAEDDEYAKEVIGEKLKDLV